MSVTYTVDQARQNVYEHYFAISPFLCVCLKTQAGFSFTQLHKLSNLEKKKSLKVPKNCIDYISLWKGNMKSMKSREM